MSDVGGGSPTHSSNCNYLGCMNFKVICRFQSFSNRIFCSWRISTDKRVARSLSNRRASCYNSIYQELLWLLLVIRTILLIYFVVVCHSVSMTSPDKMATGRSDVTTSVETSRNGNISGDKTATNRSNVDRTSASTSKFQFDSIVSVTSASTTPSLSLIHISEPTRPY